MPPLKRVRIILRMLQQPFTDGENRWILYFIVCVLLLLLYEYKNVTESKRMYRYNYSIHTIA